MLCSIAMKDSAQFQSTSSYHPVRVLCENICICIGCKEHAYSKKDPFKRGTSLLYRHAIPLCSTAKIGAIFSRHKSIHSHTMYIYIHIMCQAYVAGAVDDSIRKHNANTRVTACSPLLYGWSWRQLWLSCTRLEAELSLILIIQIHSPWPWPWPYMYSSSGLWCSHKWI